jgi:hypothetical protein
MREHVRKGDVGEEFERLQREAVAEQAEHAHQRVDVWQASSITCDGGGGSVSFSVASTTMPSVPSAPMTSWRKS